MKHRPLTMPPDIIIRPAGVWNSRAPFNDFFKEHRRAIRCYNILTLAALRLIKDAEHPLTASRPAKKWLKVTRGVAQAGRTWASYRRSLQRVEPNTLPSPKASDVIADLDDSLSPLRKGTLIIYSSAFETFFQCWTLNYLLSRLERGFTWTKAERALARDFSPVHGSRDLPGIPRIVQAIPALADGISSLPTFVTSAETDVETPAPVESKYNALEGIRFWRAVRNFAVHRSGIINTEFIRRHYGFMEKLRENYPYMPPPEQWTRILFYDDLIRAMLAVHYRVARWMSDDLESISETRRGHPLAPAAKPDVPFFSRTPVSSPPLLMLGDHESSYRWSKEVEFRIAFSLNAVEQ